MALIPDNPSSVEWEHWRLAQRSGQKITLQDLQTEFPERGVWGPVEVLRHEDGYIGTGYSVIGRKEKPPRHWSEQMAYSCDGCEGTFIGPPRLTDENSIAPLSGRKGYDMYCHGCGAHLDEVTFFRS